MTSPNDNEWRSLEDYWRRNLSDGADRLIISKIVAEAERRTWEEAISLAFGFGVQSDKPCHEAEIIEAFNARLSSLTKK